MKGERLMWWHSVDYKAQGGDVRGALVNRGFWLRLPRLTLACRLLGHEPVVDGTSGFNGRPGNRWVCCDRCGVRPQPQGILNPAMWDIGDRVKVGGQLPGAGVSPGNWPASPEGTVGGQLIIGGRVTAGVSVEVDCAGGENTLAANACIPFLGGLYLHTENFGTWVQRRLNPVGYESRVISLHVHDGHAYWRLWSGRDGRRKDEPGWRNSSVRVDPRDILLGERRYSYEDVTGEEPVSLLLPDGTEYAVTMKLQRQSHGRKKGRKRESWTVDIDCREGIPTRSDGHRGGLCGWAVPVSDRAVEAGMWQQEAIAASIAEVTGTRIRYGYREPGKMAAYAAGLRAKAEAEAKAYEAQSVEAT